MSVFPRLTSKSLRLVVLACGLLGCTFAWAAAPATHTVLSYGNLLAFDAGHHPLPAQMALAGKRLTLNIDTRGARYPVTLDPLFSTTLALREPSPAANDQFGLSVALTADGATALVGADGTNGASQLGIDTTRRQTELERADDFAVALWQTGDPAFRPKPRPPR